MLHVLEDRERLRPLYERQPLVTIRARNILFGLRLPRARLLVDDPVEPHGALLSHDGMLWDLYSPDPAVAHTMLDQFVPPAERALFVGIAEPLIEHVTRRFRVLVHTPTDLYLLGAGSVPSPAGAAQRSEPSPTLPLGQRLSALGPEHARLVAAAWPHDDFEEPEGKIAYIKACIEQGPTVALLDEDRLVAFVLTHSDGSMGVLHVMPAQRRRGLGRQVLTALMQELRHRSAPVFGYVAVGNAPSAKLVESLGLRAVQRGAWLTVAR